MFLFPGLGRPNLCGMTDAILDSQLIQQLQEPLHRTGGFDLDHDQPFQGRIKFSYSLSFVVNYLFNQFAGFGVQHGNALLLCVSIDAYNFHLGLLRPSLFGWIPKVYSGRREADVLMSSATPVIDSYADCSLSFEVDLTCAGGIHGTSLVSTHPAVPAAGS